MASLTLPWCSLTLIEDCVPRALAVFTTHDHRTLHLENAARPPRVENGLHRLFCRGARLRPRAAGRARCGSAPPLGRPGRRHLLPLRVYAPRWALSLDGEESRGPLVEDGDGEDGRRLGRPVPVLGRRRARLPRPQSAGSRAAHAAQDECRRRATARRRSGDLPRTGRRGPQALQAPRLVLHLAA